MDKKKFASFFESLAQMDEIVRGELQPSREFYINAHCVIGVREETTAEEIKSRISGGKSPKEETSVKPRA